MQINQKTKITLKANIHERNVDECKAIVVSYLSSKYSGNGTGSGIEQISELRSVDPYNKTYQTAIDELVKDAQFVGSGVQVRDKDGKECLEFFPVTPVFPVKPDNTKASE